MDVLGVVDGICSWLSERTKALYGVDVDAEVTEPESPDFGDWTTNVPFQLARMLRKPPQAIGEEIVADKLPPGVGRAEVVGGYINFWLSERFLCDVVREVNFAPQRWGCIDYGRGELVQVEFVSANPTGPLNVVSARAAAAGSTLANALKAAGFKVKTEYYLNDAGNQIRLLGESFRARLAQLRGEEAEIPEGGYHGEYLLDYAREYLESAPGLSPDEWILRRIVEQQKSTLSRFRVHFDCWFSEREFRRSGKVEEVLDRLGRAGLTYEKDGALWFAASKVSPQVDDFVLVKSDGEWAYGLVDIAYHANKFEERGFSRVYTILGPDHHGHKARLEAAMKALGHEGKLCVLILQQVNLVEDGKRIKMSKRAGKLVTMDELIDDVGVDAARFFFLARRMEAHLDFDMNLARDTSEKNPVYYIQYAHARIQSILRYARERGISCPSNVDLVPLTQPEELQLMRRMTKFPSVVLATARLMQPHVIPFFLLDFAKLFHNFYTKHRVVCDDEALTSARLALVAAVGNTIRRGLEICGISAPEQM